MDARGGKILEFLKENSHLDLEVPDIAFNVKKSEKTVEAALKKFQQKGLVTARQNEFGRVYWYALPSAPITKILKAEELLSADSAVESGADDDEAVDLSSLTTPDPRKKKTSATRKTTSSTARKKTTSAKAASRKAPKTAPAPEPEIVERPEHANDNMADEATFEPEPVREPASEPVSVNEVEEERGFAPAVKTSSASGMLLQIAVGALALLALILGGAALSRGGKLSGKISAVEATIPKEVVTPAELKAVEEKVDGIAVLEGKIDSLTVKVDSLTGVLTTLTEKKTVRRRTKRRRR